jgi:two-component system chemotaxis response regulator CheB
MFESVAQSAGRNAIAVLLTGMGKDGALGLKCIREAGGYTAAQDEASSVVYGMPREAMLLGAAEDILPLNKVANALIQQVKLRGGGNRV